MNNAERRRNVRTHVLITMALAIVTVLVAPVGFPTSSRSAAATTTAVTSVFSRPTMRNVIRIRLSTGADHLRLNDRRDYVLVMPTRKKTGVLEIRGGRNVIVVGGYLSVSSGDANIIVADGPDARKGRVVHLEGLLIDGSSGARADGIRINAPRAVVQIVFCRIVGLRGSGGTVHADVIQPFGGVRALRIDRLTASSQYNGLYLRRETYPLRPRIRRVRIVRANIIGLWNGSSVTPDETIRGISIGTQPKDPSNDDASVNCRVSGRVTLRRFYVKPARKHPGQFLYPHDGMRRAGCPAKRTKDGSALRWPALRDRVRGVVRIGAPDGGDFVPAARVGLNY